MLKIFLSLFLLLFVFNSFGTETKLPIKWNGNIYKIIHKYNKIHKRFSKKVCQPGDEKKYWDLLKNYRGQGHYLPKLNDDIDRKAIRKNIHHFEAKLKHITDIRKKLKSLKEFPKFQLIQIELNEIVSKLLLLKKKFKVELRVDQKNELLKESQLSVTLLKKQFDVYIDQIFFLKSFGFPNDYLSYREKYEKYKDLPGTDNKEIANETFFFRRIVEDGAYDLNRTYPDKFTRTALDTLYININNEEDFISENVRYDLEWIEKSIERILRRGKKVQMSRMKEWFGRTQQNLKFYKEISKSTNKKKAQFLVKKKNESTKKLKEFVYKKQAEVYEFWARESELNKALFSFETILVNEVGVLDGKFGLERTSVAKVVANRFFDDFYNQLDDKQLLYSFIDPSIDKSREFWLNVLFRVGEFSFTYHYISAVVKTFCPDMSPRGRSIRKDNLKISLKVINKFDHHFNAFRYFSRISMTGKIDMSSVWTGYKRLPEMVGYESSHQHKLLRHYLADKYVYLYSFLDEKNLEFRVVKINGRTYSMRWEKGQMKFFDYRNPHLFAYFSKKN